jgi:hypothetical protein
MAYLSEYSYQQQHARAALQRGQFRSNPPAVRIRTDRGVSNIPYPKHPSLPKGEDRVGLISTEDESMQGGIVVDGVGGSSNFALGVDSGTFAEELIGAMRSNFLRFRTIQESIKASKEQLHARSIKGTGTVAACCINTLTGIAEIMTIGDAQLVIIRKGQVVFRSIPHYDGMVRTLNI